ncbi:hypothetical protein [Paenibacillus typhae]|nr:hypothetical protein [Paenibacillus typhae]
MWGTSQPPLGGQEGKAEIEGTFAFESARQAEKAKIKGLFAFESAR